MEGISKETACTIISCQQDIYEELCIVETLVKMMHEICLENEIRGNYYDLNTEKRCYLSKERNNYINVLRVISERLNKMQKLSGAMENSVTRAKPLQLMQKGNS